MKLITIRNVILLILLTIPVLFAVRALRPHSDLGPEASFEAIPDNVDLTLKNIKYTKTSKGVPLWTLVAESAAQSEVDNIIRVNDLHLDFFDPEYDTVSVTADQGEFRTVDRRVIVSSNVNVQMAGPRKTTLQTEDLEYEEKSNILQTDKMVKITSDNISVCGKGMRLDIGDRTLTLLSNVKVEINGLDGEFSCP